MSTRHLGLLGTFLHLSPFPARHCAKSCYVFFFGPQRAEVNMNHIVKSNENIWETWKRHDMPNADILIHTLHAHIICKCVHIYVYIYNNIYIYIYIRIYTYQNMPITSNHFHQTVDWVKGNWKVKSCSNLPTKVSTPNAVVLTARDGQAAGMGLDKKTA